MRPSKLKDEIFADDLLVLYNLPVRSNPERERKPERPNSDSLRAPTFGERLREEKDWLIEQAVLAAKTLGIGFLTSTLTFETIWAVTDNMELAGSTSLLVGVASILGGHIIDLRRNLR